MTTAKQIIKDSYKILGIRFLEVAGSESAITTESVISQAFNKIGIFYKPVAGSESAETADSLISQAFQKINIFFLPVAGNESTETADSLISQAFQKINMYFLPVAGNESAETADALISQAFNKLGIFFLPVVGNESTATSEVIVSAALRKIQIKNSETPLTAQELADGNEVLNDLITQWLYDGIDLGVTSVPSSGSSTLPTWSLSAVKSNLAVMLASEYERPITDSLSSDALSSLALLKERTEPINQAVAIDIANNLIQEWAYNSIDLGVSGITLGAASNLPTWSLSAFVSNLAVRLAPVYEKPLSESLTTQAAQGIAMLSERTEPANNQIGIDTANNMLEEWAYDSIDLGTSSLSLGVASNLPKWSLSAFVSNLAVRLASNYGKPVPESLAAQAVKGQQMLSERTEPANNKIGIDTANNMLEEWAYDSIDLGVTDITLGLPANLPKWSLSAFVSNLAVRLASNYDKPIPDSLAAQAVKGAQMLYERTEPANNQVALDAINNMLPEWLYDDIDLGVTSLSLGAASNLPDWAIGSVVSNLSVRLAAIYEKPLNESLIAQSTQSMMMLKERTSEGNLDNGLNFLNEMMAEWDQLNIRIGYLNPTTINGDTGLPDYSIAAVKYNLALRIAPITEKPLTQSMVTSAQESYKNLIRQTVTDGIFTIYPDILPIGQGNKRCNVDNENYFANPADNDLTTNIEVIGAS